MKTTSIKTVLFTAALFVSASISVIAQEKKTITVQVDGDKMTVNGVPVEKAQKNEERIIIKADTVSYFNVGPQQKKSDGTSGTTITKKIIVNGRPLSDKEIDEIEVEGKPLLGGGFAFPDDIKKFRGFDIRMEDDAPAPKIGLTVQDIEDRDAVKVIEVKEGSQAEKAGLKKGDLVTTIDGRIVKGTDDILRALKPSKDRVSVSFGIERSGKSQSIEVRLPKKIKTVEL
jgi:membrane-associated protease RseP (regulator of RpoE activity)